MIAVTIPTTDVNSESAEIVRWYVGDHAEVTAGEPLLEVETSKAILDVEAPNRGVLLHMCAEGDQLRIDQPLGYLFETLEALEIYERQRRQTAPANGAQAGRITAPARRRAAELGLDIDEIARGADDLVTTKLVEAVAAQSDNGPASDLP